MANLYFFESPLLVDLQNYTRIIYIKFMWIKKLIINPLTPLIPVTSYSSKSDPIEFNLNIKV